MGARSFSITFFCRHSWNSQAFQHFSVALHSFLCISWLLEACSNCEQNVYIAQVSYIYWAPIRYPMECDLIQALTSGYLWAAKRCIMYERRAWHVSKFYKSYRFAFGLFRLHRIAVRLGVLGHFDIFFAWHANKFRFMLAHLILVLDGTEEKKNSQQIAKKTKV